MVEVPLDPTSADWSAGAPPFIAPSTTPEKRCKRTSLKVSTKKTERLKSKGKFQIQERKVTNSQVPGVSALMNLMILSVHSSAEEMVANITVNDPGKHFPVLRKTIQLIQSLKKKRQIGNKR